jgi:SAM-dependent methyltransferase
MTGVSDDRAPSLSAIVAVAPAEVAAGERALRDHGAGKIESRSAGPHRALLLGRFADDAGAEQAVAALRSRGWSAAVRPVAGGHLAAWHSHTRPVVVADRLWVCFPWTEADCTDAPMVVEIDPGLAFGAGAHPTTRLLLGALVRRLRGGESVLDVGCGSGVLAVSAARLGAARVTAVDVDGAAIDATRANATRNGLAGEVDASVIPVAELTGTFDVIVANIGAPVLVDLAPVLRPRLAPLGWLGLSGLSPAQASTVAAAYPTTRVIDTPVDGDWAAVIVTSAPRPTSRPRVRSRTSPMPGC